MPTIELNYMRDKYWRNKIASKIKELQSEVESSFYDKNIKNSEIYNYNKYREFAMSKLYELLKEK